MSQQGYRLSQVVRSIILESAQRLMPSYRDPVTGVILDKKLAEAVIADLDQQCEEERNNDIVRLGRHDAWPVAVYTVIREHIRGSKGKFETHHRQQRAAERRTASRQRLLVTFRDATGEIVTKDRRFLRMDELPLVWSEYERRGQANLDVAEWCHAVWDQMKLRGFGDDALVSEVVTLVDDDQQSA